jgi:NADPH:quinone reductase-like Zn-dependent oxidoreductase
MRAAVITRYGPPDVVTIRDVPRPEPARNDILVRVHATTVSRTDCGELRGHPYFYRLFVGLRRPRRTIFGVDFAGIVEAAGADITAFRPGDRVFGLCASRRNGAQADYVCVGENYAAAMPKNLPFAAAVLGEGAFYAAGTLRMIRLTSGDRILIYGATGAIGTAMVQLAKAAGAHVTAVVATPHIALAASLGADRVVDYTAGDFARLDERFDSVVDAVGRTTYFQCRRLLKPGGVFAATDMGPGGQTLMLALWSMITRSGRVLITLPGRVDGFVGYLKDLMETGRLRAVIDRRYPLEAIADAYRFVETGQKVGIVVIDVVKEA